MLAACKLAKCRSTCRWLIAVNFIHTSCFLRPDERSARAPLSFSPLIQHPSAACARLCADSAGCDVSLISGLKWLQATAAAVLLWGACNLPHLPGS